jgi:hypothetical protein
LAEDTYERPTGNTEWDEYIRLGHIGKTEKKWDDGFYVSGIVVGFSTIFLIGTGSTATIISKYVFDSLDPHIKRVEATATEGRKDTGNWLMLTTKKLQSMAMQKFQQYLDH